VAREWNNPIREPWTGVIKTALDAVDQHNAFYFRSNDTKHLIAADLLRSYVKFLKDFLIEAEKV